MLRVLKRNGIDTKRKQQSIQKVRKGGQHTGTFARWLALNSGKMLPRNIDKLKKLSGCTKDSIVCYFYRRRKRLKDFIKTIPDLRTNPITLVDPFGRTYDSSAFRDYEYLIDKYSLKVRIMAKTFDGEKLLFDVPDIEHFHTVAVNHRDQSQVLLSSKEIRAKGPHRQSTEQPSYNNEDEYFQVEAQDNSDEAPPLS